MYLSKQIEDGGRLVGTTVVRLDQSLIDNTKLNRNYASRAGFKRGILVSRIPGNH